MSVFRLMTCARTLKFQKQAFPALFQTAKSSRSRVSNHAKVSPYFTSATCFRPIYEKTDLREDREISESERVIENILKHIPSKKITGKDIKDRRIFTALVENEPGVLSKISGLISARGFNIDSLTSGRTHVHGLSRMTLVFYDTQGAAEQLRAHLEDLVPIWAIIDHTDARMVERELCLIKVCLDEENSELNLRMRRDLNRRALTELTSLFGGKIQDVGMQHVIIELTTKPHRIITFLKLLRPYGIVETGRSGVVTMLRAEVEGEQVIQEKRKVDASLLPPS